MTDDAQALEDLRRIDDAARIARECGAEASAPGIRCKRPKGHDGNHIGVSPTGVVRWVDRRTESTEAKRPIPCGAARVPSAFAEDDFVLTCLRPHGHDGEHKAIGVGGDVVAWAERRAG